MAKNHKWESDSLINLLRGEEYDVQRSCVDRMITLQSIIGLSYEGSVNFHKKRLGKQNYTWNGEYRFWVWEGPNWRVYASNICGTSFEARAHLTPTEALQALQDYFSKISL